MSFFLSKHFIELYISTYVSHYAINILIDVTLRICEETGHYEESQVIIQNY
jgi:hypothetical protein